MQIRKMYCSHRLLSFCVIDGNIEINLLKSSYHLNRLAGVIPDRSHQTRNICKQIYSRILAGCGRFWNQTYLHCGRHLNRLSSVHLVSSPSSYYDISCKTIYVKKSTAFAMVDQKFESYTATV